MTALVLDSNLVILLIVGITDRNLIGKHRRLRAYSLDDFEYLLNLIRNHGPIIVSPNVLTEVSNLCRQISEPVHRQISSFLERFIADASEEYVASNLAIQNDQFAQLGLTDAVILEQMDAARLLLTADHDLYIAARRRNHRAINFNHVRPL